MAWSDRQYDDFTYRRFENFPLGTALICGVTILISILLWGFGGGVYSETSATAIEYGGVSVARLLRFEVWRLFSYALLHGSTGHLLGNMFMALIVGFLLEGRVGRWSLVRMYACFAVAAGLAVFLKPVFVEDLDLSIPTIGASGAVLGLVGFFGSRYAQESLLFLGLVPIKAWLLASILIAYDLIAVIGREGGRTDHLIHLGGAAAGFALGFLWPRARVKWGNRVEHMQRQSIQKRRVRDAVDSQEMDRILQKIKDQGGMHVLDDKERRFLARQSRKYQERRRS